MMTSANVHRIESRWDRQAIAQLRAEVTRPGAENDELRGQLYRMEDCAESWREDAMNFPMELCRRSGGEPGITAGGALVIVPTETEEPA